MNTKIAVLLGIGMILGVIFWGGFNTTMEATNSMDFCISCHEMRDNVYQEYKETIHYSNSSGVQATCSDCHVPKEWTYKLIRKIQASAELYHKAMGTIDTREKFLERREYLAGRVQEKMRATDSRECRNCHSFDNMDFEAQDNYAARKHGKAIDRRNHGKGGKQTCIDCHTGIAHEEP